MMPTTSSAHAQQTALQNAVSLAQAKVRARRKELDTIRDAMRGTEGLLDDIAHDLGFVPSGDVPLPLMCAEIRARIADLQVRKASAVARLASYDLAAARSVEA